MTGESMTEGPVRYGDRTAEIRARVEASERDGVGPRAVEVALAIGERREWREVDVSRGDLHVRWRTDELRLLIYWRGAVVYEKCPLWSDGTGDPFTSVKSYVPGPWEEVLLALKDDAARAAHAEDVSRRARSDVEVVERWGLSDGVVGRRQVEVIVAEKVKRPNSDVRFMRLAREVASSATCGRAHVGALLVIDKQILATGYNGAIREQPHCEDVGCLMVNDHCVRTVHAEANAVAQAARHGVRVKGATLYTTTSTCWSCFMLAANAGVVRIVSGASYWATDQNDLVVRVAAEIGVELVDLSDEASPRVVAPRPVSVQSLGSTPGHETQASDAAAALQASIVEFDDAVGELTREIGGRPSVAPVTGSTTELSPAEPSSATSLGPEAEAETGVEVEVAAGPAVVSSSKVEGRLKVRQPEEGGGGGTMLTFLLVAAAVAVVLWLLFGRIERDEPTTRPRPLRPTESSSSPGLLHTGGGPS